MGPPTSNHLFLNADNSKLISLVTIILNVDLLWCGRSRILCLCALHLLSATSFSTFNHQTPDVYLLFQMWIFLPVPIILRKANNLNNLLTCLSVTNQLLVSGRVTVLKQENWSFTLNFKTLDLFLEFGSHTLKVAGMANKVLHCLAPSHLYSLSILCSLSTS